MGETIVLVAAVAAPKAKPGQDFFPLTVDYREKAAAAGKFPGGYFNGEGRPTEKEILTSRLIDRPIRPVFPKGWYNAVQVQCMVLSADGEKNPDQITLNVVPDEILKEAKALAGDRIITALLTVKKLDREQAVAALTDEVGKKLVEKFGEEKVTDFVLKDAFYYIQKEAVRGLVMNNSKRLDGRDFDAVRPIFGEVGILPRAHGSAIFQRGETQALTLCTLGTGEDAQEFDSYTGGASEKKFILHYNFPNFSVGETGRISGPGRREIGHVALAERSLQPMVPADNYPYSIRITSEIMESNGSTSMASVCGGFPALFDCRGSVNRAR